MMQAPRSNGQRSTHFAGRLLHSTHTCTIAHTSDLLSGPFGSGKTTLAVERIRWLLRQERVRGDDILVLVPQRTLAHALLRRAAQPRHRPAGRLCGSRPSPASPRTGGRTLLAADRGRGWLRTPAASRPSSPWRPASITWRHWSMRRSSKATSTAYASSAAVSSARCWTT